VGTICVEVMAGSVAFAQFVRSTRKRGSLPPQAPLSSLTSPYRQQYLPYLRSSLPCLLRSLGMCTICVEVMAGKVAFAQFVSSTRKRGSGKTPNSASPHERSERDEAESCAISAWIRACAGGDTWVQTLSQIIYLFLIVI